MVVKGSFSLLLIGQIALTASGSSLDKYEGHFQELLKVEPGCMCPISSDPVEQPH